MKLAKLCPCEILIRGRRYGLSPGVDYYISYEITTINGFKKSSPRYKIMDGQTVPSNIFKYCNFVATNNPESACVELSI